MVGLPGSGKSYLLQNIVLDDTYILTEELFYKKCSNIKTSQKLKSLLFNIIRFFDVFLLLFSYSILKKKNKKYYLKKVTESIKYLSLYDIIIREKRDFKSILLDQGLVQEIWSYTFFLDNPFSSIVLSYCIKRCIKSFKIEIAYYEVDYKVAAKRANSREKKCEIDYLNYNEILKLYSIHYKDIDIISKSTNCTFKVFSNKKELENILNN